MSLPEPILYDLRFQKDLVDEARRRIIRYCPEWTDYNVSDPGITLIELFAWMTEMIVYRLNQVPEKNYIKFLEFLGIQLRPASSAATELTFWLSTPFPISPGDDTMAVVPQGAEVATRRTEEEDEVIFTTDKRLMIIPPQLIYLYSEQDFQKNYLPQLGKRIFYPFQEQPQVGDTFYLGFDPEQDLSGQILQLTFICHETQAVGIKRDDPPLRWECSLGNGEWQEVYPSDQAQEEDTTGGLNNPEGRLVLYLPLAMKPDQMYGRMAYWVRCRLDPRRPDEQGMYTRSPQIKEITPHTLGGTVQATHAIIARDELLGNSNGEPSQTFKLENAPVLELRGDETVTVEEKADRANAFVPWRLVQSFSRSDRFDRHFIFDNRTGEVCFGPNIRGQDGAMAQFGRIPPAGSEIRFTQYRYGGGTVGNVPVGKIQVLKSSIPYIDRVSNLCRASGGRDPESLEEARLRAQRELRAQYRAVTAEDYENLALQASRMISRVKCNSPQKSDDHLPPGMVEILVVPSAVDALKIGDLSKLCLNETLIKTVKDHLDKYRLLTTILKIREPRYIGVRVQANIIPSEYSRPEVVKGKVIDTLKQFINCLDLTVSGEPRDELMGLAWLGWPFGRNLYVAEVFSLIQRVPGVKHVLKVELYQRAVTPSEEMIINVDETEEKEKKQLKLVEGNVLRVAADALLCSLDHQIIISELEGDEDGHNGRT